MAAKHEGSKKYNLDKTQLIERTKIALGKCRFNILNLDEANGEIQAKSKLSFWSWTENINIKIEENGKVIMKSECAFPTQIIDWGKNKRNVNKFFQYLD